MAYDKNGRPLEVGKRVKVESAGDAPWGGNPAGSYEGVITDLHEDGAYVLPAGSEERTTPLASECEVLGEAPAESAPEDADKPKRRK